MSLTVIKVDRFKLDGDKHKLPTDFWQLLHVKKSNDKYLYRIQPEKLSQNVCNFMFDYEWFYIHGDYMYFENPISNYYIIGLIQKAWYYLFPIKYSIRYVSTESISYKEGVYF